MATAYATGGTAENWTVDASASEDSGVRASPCCVLRESGVETGGEVNRFVFFSVISGMETGMGEVNRCISSVISDRGAV